MIGAPAPDFELESDSGDTVRLSDFRGQKVILYFYPRDNTPGCTKQACGFQQRLADFEARGYVVLGVSPDPPERHRQFREKYGLAFALLSDPEHRVADAWGAWGRKKLYGREYEGILRSTFVLDENGIVLEALWDVRPDGHADRLLARL